MKIETFAIAWNEERAIDQYIEWYNFADKITILDNHSTDKTVEIALAKGCTVIPYGTNEQNNKIMLETKENCWKGSTADWVIVGDIDEFIYHPNLLNLLANTEATIIRCKGYQMVSEQIDLYKNVKEGTHWDLYDKCICFKPTKITEMNWESGCHRCHPRGEVRFLENEVKLLHFNLIGREAVQNRYTDYDNRRGEWDRSVQAGYQYAYKDKAMENWFNSFYNRREKVW